MKIDNLLNKYSVAPYNISLFREMLLDEYFPKFANFPADKIVEKTGEVLHEMFYLHSLMSLEVNPNFEIWEIAKWLSSNRYLNYSFVSDKCGYGTAYKPLASYLGTAVYDWCKAHAMDDRTKETLMKLFDEVGWERG